MHQDDFSVLKVLVDNNLSLTGATSLNLTPLAENVGKSKDEVRAILGNLQKTGHLRDYTQGAGGEVVFITMDITGQRIVKDEGEEGRK